MDKPNYNMSFSEVLNLIFSENGWYQGEKFKAGVFIKLDTFGNVHLYGFLEDKMGEQDFGLLPIDIGIYNQKFRRVSFQSEIMKK